MGRKENARAYVVAPDLSSSEKRAHYKGRLLRRLLIEAREKGLFSADEHIEFRQRVDAVLTVTREFARE